MGTAQNREIDQMADLALRATCNCKWIDKHSAKTKFASDEYPQQEHVTQQVGVMGQDSKRHLHLPQY